MPTPNMSDEELDSLFQRGAEAYPDDNYLGAWERMETKLNAATSAQLLRQKVRGLFAAEIVVFSLLLWQSYEFTRSITAVKQPLPAVAQATRRSLAVGAKPAATVGRHNAAEASSLALATDGVLAIPEAPPLASQSAPSEAAASATPSVATSMSATAATGQVGQGRTKLAVAGLVTTVRHQVNRSKLGVSQDVAVQPAYPLAGRQAGRADKGKSEKAFTGTSSSRFGPALVQAGALGLAKVDSLVLRNPSLASGALGLPLPEAPTKLAVQPTADSAAAKKRSAARPAYRVVVGVLGAPAATAVRTAQSARLGGDFGLTVEYRFTNRLRVRTGLISSEKRYEAPSTDYTVPASWQWYTADYDVHGSCRITEIPIDLRYDVLSRPAYMVFASVGLNSLFMREERYSYDWMQNGQTFTKEARVVDGSQHVLSVLNFSAGVERKLGTRWSGQVEPFLQLPLGGVGAGQVRLSSLGAAFSLKFGLFR